jgi:hypothetical protein
MKILILKGRHFRVTNASTMRPITLNVQVELQREVFETSFLGLGTTKSWRGLTEDCLGTRVKLE